MTSSDIGRRLRRAFWALTLVALLAVVAPIIIPAGEDSGFLFWIGALFWPAALLLSLGFGNSRLFFTSLLTSLAWLSYQPTVSEKFLSAPALPVVILLPLLLVVLQFVSDKGIVTQASLRAWIVVLLFAFLYLLWAQGPPAFAPEAARYLLEGRRLLTGLRFTPAELLYLLVGGLLLARAFLADRVTEGVPLGFLLAAYLGYQEVVPGDPEFAWAVVPLLATTGILIEAYSHAYVDTLTRLPGRRSMESYGKQLGKRYAVAMIDIDHFKQFNDTHGHHVGDQVLRMVAGRLRGVGAGGRVFRYGGEEFTILFRHDDRDAVTAELERLRSVVGDKPFVLRGSSRPPDRKGKRQRGWGSNRQKATVTISLGVAFSSGHGRKIDDVRKKADEALYKAKKKGRNRVEFA